MRKALIAATLILLSQCSRPALVSNTAPSSRWVLLSAPSLMNKNEDGEPCTGTPYVRAPLADWEKLGEYNSFQECAAAISAPHPDTDPEHQKGKLSRGELMLGFKCVQTTDDRLSSSAPYNWKTESLAEQ